MEVKLKWGHDAVAFDLPDRNVIGVLEPEGGEPVADLWEATWDLLETPTAGEPFADIVERVAPKKIAIIVNDMTRSTPTQELLPPILKKLDLLDVARESVVIVVATGTHRAMTAEEIDRILGPDIPKTYRVVNHDCDAPDLVSLGTLSTGNELRICREVAEADMRIAIGEVLLHYYAGFAGGRKSILPGVAARETVMSNHKMMTRPGVDIGVVRGNPLSDEMIEAVERFCPLHFIVNCVSDSRKNIIRVVGGHTCGHQMRNGVVGGRAPAAFDQRREVGHHRPERVAERFQRAGQAAFGGIRRDDRLGPAVELVAVRLGYAQVVRDHHRRQRLEQLGDDVAAAGDA